ncbi:hypothetical protein A2526_04825 [candidate division WOR-1 bacterium RIFOXYD2_FULL_36_8]|nr:MAG: hypothetical protein A2526_04825 [candidate division WOR-1 bacterium RIFOXYD2_FULL_36_8]
MSMESTILVVDDETSIRESFKLIFSDKYHLLQAASGEGAIKQIADHSVDVAYLDIRMPGMDGIETLKRLKELSPQTQVVMVTAVNDVQRASEAIKLGAFNYVVKPFDVDFILGLTKDLLIRKGMLSAFAEGSKYDCLPPFIKGIEKIEEMTLSDDWILISGEPGVEKEWVAHYIHQQSKETKPFIVFEVERKPQSLIEKELFGLVGGNTVADIRREPGITEEAGTIFIDNIEYLPRALQNKIVKIPSRLICGSSVNQQELDIEKSLKDRLLKNIIHIPPLRARAADISVIFDYFFDKALREHVSFVRKISPEARDILTSYSWPGNIEELRVVLDRLVLICQNSVIKPENLPLNILISSSDVHSLPLEEVYSEFETGFIKLLLEKNSNNRLKTSQMLGIQPRVLDTKI